MPRRPVASVAVKCSKKRKIVLSAFALLCVHNVNEALQSSDVDAFSTFLFKTPLEPIEFEKICAFSEIQRVIVHVAKESAPVVPFGGVGQVVGDLSISQSRLHGTAVAVILPRYGFIQDARPLMKFHFSVSSAEFRGMIYYSTHANLTYFLVGPPAHIPKLWQSKRIEDVYDIPSAFLRKGKAYHSDLYFSFIAAKLISSHFFCKRLHQEAFHNCGVVHVHGGSNAPTLWFLRQLRPTFPMIYTIHDYNREPHITYPVQSLLLYTRSRAFKQESMLCDKAYPSRFRQQTLRRSNKIYAADLAWCSNVLTTVSKGMFESLVSANEQYADLLYTYVSQGRFSAIPNWVPQRTWHKSRELVSASRPHLDKSRARKMLFSKFSNFLVGAKHPTSAMRNCIVLWIARFEVNKGTMLLPPLYETTCSMSCTFIIFGHWTNAKSKKLFRSVIRQIERADDCSYFLFSSLESQRLSEEVVRAAADIVVVPSQYEAFGLVAAEALAYGSIPVVSSAGGLPDIVRPFNGTIDGEWTGFVFPMFVNRPDATSRVAQSTLSLAITTLRSQSEVLRLGTLQRIIRSTPLDTPKGKSNSYEAIVKQLSKTCTVNPTFET